MLSHPELDLSEFRHSVWILGILSCLYGTLDRILALFTSNYLSLVEIFHLLAVSCLLLGWIYLKPEHEPNFFDALKTIENPEPYPSNGSSAAHDTIHLIAAQTRMQDLNQHHVIRQLHVLPFPFICQIYHLLNLKHLESVHSVSLSNLKVVDISHLAPTDLGGTVKFRTTVESPLSILKLWRQPIVEVELTLHSLYTVELSIPVYGGKKMTVIFNAFPLSKRQHEFLIDIYTDLNWPKPILQLILHIASLVTLYEDLPYLQKLSEREWFGLLNKSTSSTQNINWLFDRFVELYALKLETTAENELEYANFAPT
jgi:hypothetical protein